MRFSRLLCLFLAFSYVLVYGDSLYSSTNLSSTDLYRVTVSSKADAGLLIRLKVDPIIRVKGGYLILASKEITSQFDKAGLEYQLICAKLTRENLMTVTENTPRQIDRYPLIFEEGGLRLYRAEVSELPTAREEFHLRPLAAEHLRIQYQQPLQLDAEKSTDMELDSLVSLISQDSLESYLYHIEGYDNRWWGTPGNGQCRIWAYDKMRDYGYDSVYLDDFAGYGVTGNYGEGKNIVAVKLGTTYPDIHIVIGGHFDSGSNEDEHFPGADDNGTGTGGTLEIARAMADIDTRLTYVFILFDAEEAWMVGSLHYATEAAARGQKIACMINMDMIGHEDNDSEAYLHYYLNDAYAQLWTQVAATIPGIGITGHITDYYGLVSDQGPFAEAGYDVVFVQEYEFSTNYHFASDSAVYLNFDYMTRMVQATIATAYVTDQQYEPEYEMYITGVGDLPELLYPQRATPVAISVHVYGGAQIIPGSVLLHYYVNGSEEMTVPMTAVGDAIFAADLPPLNCSDAVRYQFSAEDDSLGAVYFPGPDEMILAGVASGMSSLFEDSFDSDQGWTVETYADRGGWQRYESAHDYDNDNYEYATGTDFLTLRDGVTRLISPAIEINGINCTIQYARWFAYLYDPEPGQQADSFMVFISPNGYNWTLVEAFEAGNSRKYEVKIIPVSDYFSPPQNIWLRFDAIEHGNDTYVGGALDAVRINGLSTDLRVVTEDIPNWTAGHPFSLQLEAAVCNDDTLSWNDRFDQLNGTGLTLAPDGLLSGIPTRVGPVVFRAEVTDQSGGYDEKSMDFIIYDSLKITTGVIPAAKIGELYNCQLKSSGGTGNKVWIDRDGDLDNCGINLSSNGLLSGTHLNEESFPFVARVTDAAGATDDISLTLRIIGPYTCGDSNGDGQVNVGDAVFLINYVFKSGPAPAPLESGDTNCDNQVNVGDAVYLINYVFKGGPEPCCP